MILRASKTPIGPGRGLAVGGSSGRAYPYTIGARLKGWWGAEWVTTSGGLVTAFDDQSPFARDGIPPSPLARPLYDDSLGFPAVYCGGSQYFEVVSEYAESMPADDWTTFGVVMADDAALNQVFMNCGIKSVNSGYAQIFTSAAKWGIRVPPVGTVLDGDADADLHYVVVGRASGTLHMAVDNIEVALDAPTAGVTAPSGVTLIPALTSALWLLVGLWMQGGAITPGLTGWPGTGNPTTGELAKLWQYINGKYHIT